MAGLYDRAHKAVSDNGSPALPSPADVTPSQALPPQEDIAPSNTSLSQTDITPEEGIELMAQIEKAVARTQDLSADDFFAYTPRRTGLAFPIAINAAALALIALAAVFLPMYFDRQARPMTGNAGTTLIGERRLVSTMRGEAEASLKSKDQEIGQIQGTLTRTAQELSALKAQADALVQKKQEELRAAFDAQLAAEKARLQGAGTTSASMDQQLAALRAQLQTAHESELAAFRKQVDADVARREGALTAALNESQRSLARAEAEKAQLQSLLDSEARNAARARGEQSRLAEQLAAVSAQSQREQLVLDQITSSYAAVASAMKAARYDEARASLSSLATYLDQEGVASLPAVQKRKPVDLFLIDALVRQLAAQASAPQAAAASATQAAAAARLAGFAEAVAAGDGLYTAGNFAGAIDKYAAGIALLETDAPGATRLTARVADAGYRQGQADLAARQDRAARPAVEAADALARRGSNAEAIAGYAAVIRKWPDSSYVARSMAGIERSITALLQKKDEDASRALQARAATAAEVLKTVGAGLSSAARTGEAAAASTQKELLALLDAKVKVRTVLDSESVKTQYPGLADALERYLELYGEEKTSEGRVVTLQDIGAVLDYMLGTKAKEALGTIWNRYGDVTERTSFQRILDRLRQLSQ